MSIKHTNIQLMSLFLSTALTDAFADYKASIVNKAFPHFDAVILTASNCLQAEGYQKQIEYRKSIDRLPIGTDFIVVPDKDNKRVGSAGSTLSVMSIEDLIDAKMVCGAGGGGFLQAILKNGVTKEDVHVRLKEVFQDFAVDVWPSKIIYE